MPTSILIPIHKISHMFTCVFSNLMYANIKVWAKVCMKILYAIDTIFDKENKRVPVIRYVVVLYITYHNYIFRSKILVIDVT